MGETIEKRKISPVLLGMELNAEELYPVEQLDSINTAIQRLQTKRVREGLKWSAKISEDRLRVVVTRIA